MPQFLHLYNGTGGSTYLRRFLMDLNAKLQDSDLPIGKYSIDTSCHNSSPSTLFYRYNIPVLCSLIDSTLLEAGEFVPLHFCSSSWA
jgi:hypothetical protein